MNNLSPNDPMIAIALSLLSGYGLAWLFKSTHRLYDRYGLLIGYLLFPAAYAGLIYAAAMVVDARSLLYTTLYGGAFLWRFWQAD